MNEATLLLHKREMALDVVATPQTGHDALVKTAPYR